MPSVVAVLFWTSADGDRDCADLRAEAIRRSKQLFPGASLYSNVETEGLQRLDGALSDALKRILPTDAGHPQDSVALFEDWAPLTLASLCDEATARHFRYLAHCTRPDNAPRGLLPELLSREFAAEISGGIENVADYIERNLERLDVEFLFFQPDLRQYRLDFSAHDDRSRLLARAALKRGVQELSEIEAWLAADPEVMRPAPAYLEIELCSVSAAGHAPDYLLTPPTDFPEQLSQAALDVVAETIEQCPLRQDLAVALGGRGEALEHPRCLDLLQRALTAPAVHTVFLESYGHTLSVEQVGALSRLDGAEKLTVILRLSTLRADRYTRFYGVDRLADVLANIESLAALDPGARRFACYVEMLRLKETEDEVQAFFDHFEKTSITPILGKYNSYGGRLADRKAADLSPIDRSFCWHLARDLYINAAGQAPICKQDPLGERGAIDILQVSPLEIFRRRAPAHAHSMAGRHQSIEAPCLSCDEWFTFNA